MTHVQKSINILGEKILARMKSSIFHSDIDDFLYQFNLAVDNVVHHIELDTVYNENNFNVEGFFIVMYMSSQ